MRASLFTEEQIIGMPKEQEVGAKTTDVCRRHGISSAIFYKFKAKYGGMEISDAGGLNAPQDENARLKWLLAEQMLDNAILTDSKKSKATAIAAPYPPRKIARLENLASRRSWWGEACVPSQSLPSSRWSGSLPSWLRRALFR